MIKRYKDIFENTINVQEVKNGDKLICIKDTVNCYVNPEKDERKLKKPDIIYPIKRGEIKTVVRWYPFFVLFEDTPIGQGVYLSKYFKLLKKKNKIERSDIDPYGEEDCGYEYENNKFNELDPVNRIIIEYSNKKEALIISKKLYELGYNIYDSLNYDNWSGFISFYGKNYDYCLGNINHGQFKNYKRISFVEFLEITSRVKKRIRISRPDIDPYDEEDWGYYSENYLNESTINKMKFNFEEEYCKFEDNIDGFEKHLAKLMIGKKANIPVLVNYNFVRKKAKIVDIKVSDCGVITLFTEKGNSYIGRYSGSDDVNIYILPDDYDLSNDDIMIKRPDIDPYGEENWED